MNYININVNVNVNLDLKYKIGIRLYKEWLDYLVILV